MVTPIPEDIRVFRPVQPLRFEATVDDVVVAEGQVAKDLNGGFYPHEDWMDF